MTSIRSQSKLWITCKKKFYVTKLPLYVIMALILRHAWNGYVYLFEDLVDHRVESLPLVGKPYQIGTILVLYLLYVLKWGPQWMQNRRPLNLDKIIIAYNALQVIACTYIFISALKLAWLRDYKWICEPIDYSNNPKAIKIARFVYNFYILKITDLLDTIFFVLRKKNNQVSFLHVYHHAGMVLIGWATTTYFAGGHGTLVGVINCFVHIIMYSYYLLTVAIPNFKNTIWLKKIVTQIQIIQFLWCALHLAFLLFKSDCEYPRWIAAVILPQDTFMFVLFLDFYYKTYIKKPKIQSNEKVQLNGNNHESNKNNNVKFTINRKRINNNGIIYNNNEFNDNCVNNESEIPFTNGRTKTNGHHK